MSNLCCTVNPKHNCRFCDNKLCDDCMKKGRTTLDYNWCKECSDHGEDYINIITEQTETVGEMGDIISDLNSFIEELAVHPRRCSDCREDEYCEALMSLISEGARCANEHQRTLRTLLR